MDILISDVILPATVDLDYGSFKDKDELFRHMVSLLYKAGKIDSEAKFLEALYERKHLVRLIWVTELRSPMEKAMR